MSSRNWSDDDELVRDLREALRPVPDEQQIIDAARDAYAWRSFDADLELAELIYDSYLDESTLVRGPASSSPRALVFGHGALRVEIELNESGIEGQLVPPEPGTVRLLTVAGTAAETTADEVGCFSFPAPQRGPIRIACSFAGGELTTEWLTT